MKPKSLLSFVLLFSFLLKICSAFGEPADTKNVPLDYASIFPIERVLNANDGNASALSPNPQMNMSLYGVNADQSIYMADGAITIYNDCYSNDVDANDGVKLSNSSENLAIKTGNTLLVVERRHTIVGTDTSFMNLTHLKIQQYRFDIKTSLLGQAGLFGYLEDTYLHTRTPLDLNGSNLIDFLITNIPASYAFDRFRIVFAPPFVLPLTFTSIKAWPKNKDVVVEWKTTNEVKVKNYTLQKSVQGNKYIIINTVAANNEASNNYNCLDRQPSAGNNFYRILSTDLDGKIYCSEVVKVYVAGEKQAVTIYPNPIINGIINLQLVNQPAGLYRMRLFNKLGQVMISKHVNYVAGDNTAIFDIGKNPAHGIYQLEITKPNGDEVNLQAMY